MGVGVGDGVGVDDGTAVGGGVVTPPLNTWISFNQLRWLLLLQMVVSNLIYRAVAGLKLSVSLAPSPLFVLKTVVQLVLSLETNSVYAVA